MVELVAPPADATPGTPVRVEAMEPPARRHVEEQSQLEVWKRVVPDLKSDAGLCTYKDGCSAPPDHAWCLPSRAAILW